MRALALKKDGEGATLYTILKDDVVAVDFSLNMGSEGSASFKGSANTVDGVTNGKFTMKMETAADSDIDADKTFADGGLSLEPTMAVSPSINFDTMEAEVTLKDLKEEGDAFSGTIRFDVNGTSDSQAVSGWVELASASTADIEFEDKARGFPRYGSPRALIYHTAKKNYLILKKGYSKHSGTKTAFLPC